MGFKLARKNLINRRGLGQQLIQLFRLIIKLPNKRNWIKKFNVSEGHAEINNSTALPLDKYWLYVTPMLRK